MPRGAHGRTERQTTGGHTCKGGLGGAGSISGVVEQLFAGVGINTGMMQVVLRMIREYHREEEKMAVACVDGRF